MIINILNHIFNKLSISVNKYDNPAQLKNYLERISKLYINIDLIRIGSMNDGGYLVPNILNQIDWCISPGISDNADFENDLTRYGIKSILIDASVKKPPIQNSNFYFIKKFLGSINNKKYIKLENIVNDLSIKKGLLLQMDIEGSEYEVLSSESIETIKKFKVMIIEFHNLKNLFTSNFFGIYRSIMEKIFLSHSICHIHPNNSGIVYDKDGIEVPDTLEITFIRNNLINECLNIRSNKKLPHELDAPNIKEKKDIVLPAIWFKKRKK